MARMTKRLKPPVLDRLTAQGMNTAHDQGRHGDGQRNDILAWWAEICPDCYLRATRDDGSDDAEPR